MNIHSVCSFRAVKPYRPGFESPVLTGSDPPPLPTPHWLCMAACSELQLFARTTGSLQSRQFMASQATRNVRCRLIDAAIEVLTFTGREGESHNAAMPWDSLGVRGGSLPEWMISICSLRARPRPT